jgi:acyl-CoA hydrolase/acetoin utilization deacetylase AcuC-like enzyme
MKGFDWKQKYRNKIGAAQAAIKLIQPGNTIFIGTGCGQPPHLIDALIEYSNHIHDAHIVRLLTMGAAPHVDKKLREKFKMNSFFIADNRRGVMERTIGDYTPMFLSEIPRQFETGRIPVDVALITVTPPDVNGLCSLGISVDIVKSATANAKYVIAQVNSFMPKTFGDCFIHVDDMDMLVPHDQHIFEISMPRPDETLRRIGQNIARIIDDGSTIECGIGLIPQALSESLKDKKDLGIHTEMFGDWIIELVDCGAITCAKKSINRGKITASLCMGSQRLYRYVDENPFFEFYPAEYVTDPYVIGQHEKMVAIHVGLEIDLTGQVCADSSGYQFYRDISGQADFIRGAARARGGKAIIAMPSTAKAGQISRIVPTLTEGAGIVTTRGDIHYVVTEYGTAHLHGKNIRRRCLDLINIAHPKFRNQLIQAAKAHKYIYEDQIELAWDQVPYPHDLEHYDTLSDGTQIFFRPVRPTDERALSEMLYSLSKKSVRTRYMTQTMAFPHKDIQHLTNVDYRRDIAIVGTVPRISGDQIVALAQYFLDPRTEVAEVAFIVQDEWQQKGMGTFLLDYITQIAEKRGVKSFYATVLPINKPMLAIFRNSGYDVSTEFDGDVYSISYELRGPEEKKPRARIRKAVFIHSQELEKYPYPSEHPFNTVRAQKTREIVQSMGLLSGEGKSEVAPEPAERTVLKKLHTGRYLHALKKATEGKWDTEALSMGIGTEDCPIFKGLYDYAVLATGGTLKGARMLLSGDADIVFNPSGGYHHAGPEKAAGFCYINDVALACAVLAERGKRVLYLDVDVHHGDGVANAFYDRSDVMTISLHQNPKTLFPGTGFENEIGEGQGKGYCVNIPLPIGTYDQAYVKAFAAIVPPLKTAYNPDVLAPMLWRATLWRT